MSDTSKYLWDEVLHKSKKEDDSAALLPIANKIKGHGITPVYKNFIIPMVREKFLTDEYCPYNIDVKGEAKNKETITVLILKHVPEKYHLFIMNYIMRKLVDLVDNNKVSKRNILFVREAATFFRATEDSILENRFKYFRTRLAHYIRMGRRGMYFALDCQSASEVRGLVQGSEDYMLMFKTTSWRDKAEMTDELKRERRMVQSQVADLAFLEKGECYVAETGKTVHKVKITLPRSDIWQKHYPNFYNSYWERFGGEWIYTKKVKDDINTHYKDIKEKYKKLAEKEDEEKKSKKAPKEEKIVQIQPIEPMAEKPQILPRKRPMIPT